MTNKELIKKLAEEAIYSAKGHFKSADWINHKIFWLIMVPATSSYITILFTPPAFWVKLLTLAGAIASTIALIDVNSSNQQKTSKDIEEHMRIGNSYLAEYKLLREMFSKKNNDEKQVQESRDRICGLDKASSKYKINLPGRIMTELLIKKEVDLEWIFK